MKKKLSLNISYRYLREQHNQLYTYNFDKGNLIKRTVLPGEAIKISGVNSSSSAQVPEKDTSPFVHENCIALILKPDRHISGTSKTI